MVVISRTTSFYAISRTTSIMRKGKEEQTLKIKFLTSLENVRSMNIIVQLSIFYFNFPLKSCYIFYGAYLTRETIFIFYFLVYRYGNEF